MLTLAAIIATIALLVAVLALVRARNAGKRAARLADSYWDLRYELGQLKAHLDRVQASVNAVDAPQAEAVPQQPQQPPTMSFVPLSSLKK